MSITYIILTSTLHNEQRAITVHLNPTKQLTCGTGLPSGVLASDPAAEIFSVLPMPGLASSVGISAVLFIALAPLNCVSAPDGNGRLGGDS